MSELILFYPHNSHSNDILSTSVRPLLGVCVCTCLWLSAPQSGSVAKHSANNRLVVQSRRFYVIIFVSIDMHFPCFGIRYQCEWPRWRIALFQFSLISTICAVGSSIGHAIFFRFKQKPTTICQQTQKKISQNPNKINRLVSILFLSKSKINKRRSYRT